MKLNLKKYTSIGSLTWVSLLMIAGEMLLYQQTFINFWIPFSVFFGGGILSFFLFRNHIRFYVENEYRVFVQVLHGLILFGGFEVFLFIGLNYFVPIGKERAVQLTVLKMDYFEDSRGETKQCATVNYHGMRKQMVFPYDVERHKGQVLTVLLNEGLFGYLIIDGRYSD